MSLIAVVKTLNAGHDFERQKMIDLGFKVGDCISVNNINMGQSSTSIYLEGFEGSFNSVFFNFKEDGKDINIYGDKRYNPYLSIYGYCDLESL